MHALTDRLEFAPPPTPGMLRSMGLAVLAHAFLLAALTWGVHWKSESLSVTAEAELWSSVPQLAAPKLVELPPEPLPKPVKAPMPLQAQPKLPDAAIALEREKLQQKKQQEIEKQRLEQLKQKKLQLENKRLQDKRDQDKKAAEEKKKSEQESRKMEAQRADNLKRMAGLAGANGESTSTGTALRSSGPSASYGGRVSARIKPNIVFADDIAGNPVAEVEVRAATNGTILSRKLTKSSGVKSWDDAVLKAIDKTEKLPPDVDGQVPGSLIISFKPKD
jgi:colicin import membrane protein